MTRFRALSEPTGSLLCCTLSRFSEEQIPNRCRVGGNGYVYDVLVVDGSVGRAWISEPFALRFEDQERRRWIARRLNELACSWSENVVLGRLHSPHGFDVTAGLRPNETHPS